MCLYGEMFFLCRLPKQISHWNLGPYLRLTQPQNLKFINLHIHMSHICQFLSLRTNQLPKPILSMFLNFISLSSHFSTYQITIFPSFVLVSIFCITSPRSTSHRSDVPGEELGSASDDSWGSVVDTGNDALQQLMSPPPPPAPPS